MVTHENGAEALNQTTDYSDYTDYLLSVGVTVKSANKMRWP